MADVASIGLTISTNGLQQGIQRLRYLQTEGTKAEHGLTGLSNAAKLVGASLIAAVGGVSFQRLISEVSSFEDSMLGLKAVSGATAYQMQALEKQARTLGATSVFSAKQAGDAQRYLAMAGFEVNEVLSATPGLLDLAAAAQIDLARASDIASNILGGFRLEVDQLGRVNDVLAATAAGANTSVDQLAEALSYAAPIAAAAGVSLEDTSAAIGTLSDAGLQAGRAGTGLLGFIRQTANLTPAAEKALASYGLTSNDVNVETQGLANVLARLKTANINTADSFTIFGSEAGPAAQILANGAEHVAEFSARLGDAEGRAKQMALTLSSGLSGSMKAFNSMVSEAALQLGDSGISGGFKSATDFAAGLLAVYNGLLPEFKEANNLTDAQAKHLESMANMLSTATTVAGSAAAAYAGYRGAVAAATVAQWAFNTAVRANPIGALITVAGAAIGTLYAFREELGLTIPQVDANTDAVASLTAGIENMSKAVLDVQLASLTGQLVTLQMEAAETARQFNEIGTNEKMSGGGLLGVNVGKQVKQFQEVGEAAKGSAQKQADLRAAIETVNAQMEKLGSVNKKIEPTVTAVRKATDASAASSKAAAKATDDLAKRIEEQRKSVQSLFGEVNKSGKAWAAYRDNLTSIEKKTSYLINPTLEMAAAIGVNAMQLNEALRAADPYAQELDKLANKYSETSTKAQELSRDIRALSDGIEKTGDPTGELTRALGEARKEMGELAEESGALETAMTRAVERMDDSFVDFWENTLSGAENTFDSFKNLAISTLAEIIHAYTTRQITAQLSAVINPGASGLGGLSGASGGGMDLMGIGKNVYNGITDGFGSINWMGAPTGAQGYTSGFGSQVAAGGGRFGGSFQNFSGFNGIASMGSGIAGSYVGGSLGGSLTGKTAGSNYGSMAGGAIGTYFGGPLGAFAGSAIGGALDSVFGSKKKKPYAKTWTGAQDADPVNFYKSGETSDYWSNTDLGTVGILSKHKLKPDDLKQWVNGIEQADNAIAAMLDESQLDRARSHVSHDYKYKGTDLAKVTEARYDAVINGIADGSSEFTAQLLGRLGRIQSDTFEQQIEKLGQILQAGRLVESLDGSVREYAKGVISANSDLQSALDEVTAGISAHSSVAEMAELLSLKFDDLRAGAVEASISLVNIAGGLDQLQASTGQYYQTYFSEHERTQRVIGNVLPVLEQYNLSLGSSKDQFRAVVSALDLNSESGRKAYAELMGVSSAFADLTENASVAQKAVQAAAVNNYQAAFDALKRSVNAEREVLRESFDATSSRIGSNIDRINESMRDGERAVDALSGALSSMFGSQQQTLGGRAAARDYLSGVSAAGSVSDYDSLEKALSIISQPSEDLYSSFADYQSDFYAAAGLIGGIKNDAEIQLGAQERSIAALERQLDQAEAQYNMESDKFDQVLDKQAAFIESQIGQQTWLERINESVLTIPQALSGITQAKGAASNGTSFTGNLNNRFGQASDKYLADNPDVAAAVQNGTFKSAYDHYLQYGQYEDNRGGFPAFATGGNHTGGWRVVGEKGPELEWTAPSKIMNSGSTMNAINTEAVRQAVDQMRVEMGGYLRDIMLSNGEINLTLDDWDGTGLPQTRSVET